MSDAPAQPQHTPGGFRTPPDDPSWTPGVRPIWVDPAEAESFTWNAFFGDDKPVEVEIGCGKAGFLLRRAKVRQDRNFLGIEWANEFYRYAADRMRRHAMTNVRMFRTDASEFIRNHCPRNSLAALHVYHPDPWPKKRHHKRRLFQKPFIKAASVCLLPGARLAVQTDHAEYFEQICAVIRSESSLEETAFFDPDWLDGFKAAADTADSLRLATNFENKYRKEGRSIYQIAANRRETPA